MTCHCEKQSDEAIQLDGSPRLLLQARDDSMVAATKTHHKPSAATATQEQLAEVWRVVVLNDR